MSEGCYCDCIRCMHHYIDEKTGRCQCQYGHIIKGIKPKKCRSYEE